MPRVIVHGGVDSPATDGVREGLQVAAEAGYRVLADDGDAVAVVVAAVRTLELDPSFNAGVGSVLNRDGDVETDAGLVEGHTGRFAGIAALTGVSSPITVAGEMLRRSMGPVLLAGEGARRFATELGFPVEDLRTSEQLASWENSMRGATRNPFTGGPVGAADTVGAIALDDSGRLAAGSSTGGLQLKLPGRVGDSAILGAGIYADGSRAVLCSGLGEAAIELTLAYRAAKTSAMTEPVRAVEWGVEQLTGRGAVGGVVIYDASLDRLAVAHNAASFPVLSHDDRGPGSIDDIAADS